MEIEVAIAAAAIIGESPTWASAERALYWIDVKKPALYRYDPATGSQRSWPMPGDIGAFGLIGEPPGAVVALRQGIFRLDFASESLTRLAPAPYDPALFRFNEGACDAAGRFWVGVAFDPTSGRLGARTLFAKVPEALGLPDGAAVDTQGGYWCALHGAGRLRRYTASGAADRDVVLPVSQPTMCAFAGEALDVLYVSSATDKLTPAQRQREPLAGALLRLRPGERGIVRPYLLR